VRVGGVLDRRGACGVTASVFGVLAGIGGATHGVGEVLQGAVPVEGIALDSWTTGPIARNMGGEPGITLLPTAGTAGAVTLVFAGLVVAWSILGIRRRHGGVVLMALSLGMLLAGGGVGPPVMGMLAGAVGRWAVDRQPRRVRRLSARALTRLGGLWPPVFVLAVTNGLFLVVGSLVLVYSIDLHQPALFEASFYLCVLSLLALLVTAPAYDARPSPADLDRVEGLPLEDAANSEVTLSAPSQNV